MILHDGRSIPRLPQRWAKGEQDRLWLAWDQELRGSTIASSAWTVPSSWTGSSELEAQAVTDVDGRSYTAANSILLLADVEVGVYEITNTVTFADGRGPIPRTVEIEVVARV